MGWELLKNKGGSISFHNPFLQCPSSLWLGIRAQSVLGTCITNFHFRFLLHRINCCIVVFEYFFLPIIVDWIWPKQHENARSDVTLSLRVNLTLIEPKFGPWGHDPTPKVGLIWGYFLDFTWIPKLDQYFGYTNPFLDPKVSPQPNSDPKGGPSGS